MKKLREHRTLNLQPPTSNEGNLEILRTAPACAAFWSAATCRRFHRVADLSATQDRVQRSEDRSALKLAHDGVSTATSIPDVALNAPQLATIRQQKSGDRSPHSQDPWCCRWFLNHP
jgi:hypothetical protein